MPGLDGMTTTLAECCGCGRPDALGIGLCAECGGAGSSGDALIFVRRADTRADRLETGSRLGQLLGDRLATPDGRAVARGDRPLVRLPAIIADRTIDNLERHGVPARSVAIRSAWSAMPAHFFVMLGAVTLVGSAAGAAAWPALIAISPVVASLLLLVAHRSMSRPLLRARAAEALPDSVQHAVLSAFGRLGAGRPRELLADLVSMARPLLASLRASRDPGAIADTIEQLVIAACATALETDRLLDSATTVRDELLPGSGMESELRAAAERCDDAARTGIDRLVDAVATMANTNGRAASLEGAAGRRLAELTHALQLETGYREEALREVDRLLAR